MNYLLTITNKKKSPFFLQLMHQLRFIDDIKEIKLSANQLKFLSDFEESIKLLKSANPRKKKFKTAQQLINEL